MSNDEILTVKETAALLKTTRQQVRKMIANKELPAVKVRREWRVLKAGLMEFFEMNLYLSSAAVFTGHIQWQAAGAVFCAGYYQLIALRTDSCYGGSSSHSIKAN